MKQFKLRYVRFLLKRVYRILIMLLLASFSIFLTFACNGKFSNTSANVGGLSPTTNCRTVQHIAGKTCIRADLKHVVTLSLPALGNALVLDIQPVGSTNHNQKEYKFPKYLEGKTAAVESLGSNAQPNLEKILLLKPDLIFGWNRNNRVTYPLLNKIAPTLLYDWQGTTTWRDHFNFMAKAVEKEDAAQKAWNHYYQRIQELKIVLGKRYQNKSISFVYFCCNKMISQANNSFVGSILTDIGLKRPKAQDLSTTYGEIPIVEEELEKIDGDILFVAAYYDNDKSRLNKLQQKPLWKKLRAVKLNHVYFVDADTWRGGDLLAANALIDDLFKYLVKNPN